MSVDASLIFDSQKAGFERNAKDVEVAYNDVLSGLSPELRKQLEQTLVKYRIGSGSLLKIVDINSKDFKRLDSLILEKQRMD